MNKLSVAFYSVCLMATPLTTWSNSANLRFESVYSKPFYQKSWFMPLTLTATTAGAVAITTFTVETAAPVAVISAPAVAGGVAVSRVSPYMTGLFAVRNWFRRNVLGVTAFINVEALGISGTVVPKAQLPGATVLLLSTGPVMSYALGEPSPQAKSLLAYSVPVPLSREIGSSETQQLVMELETAATGFQNQTLTQMQVEAITALLTKKVLARLAQISSYIGNPKSFLCRMFGCENKWFSLTPYSQEEYIANLLILAQLPEQTDNFLRYMDKIELKYMDKDSFIFYLKGYSELRKSDLEANIGDRESYYKNALKFLETARSLEPQAIEPLMLEIIAYDGLKDYAAIATLQESFTAWDHNHYSTANSTAAAYTLLGDIAWARNQQKQALQFYQLAWDETSYVSPNTQKGFLCIKLANAYRAIGDLQTGKLYFYKALAYVEIERDAEALVMEIEKSWRSDQPSATPVEVLM